MKHHWIKALLALMVALTLSCIMVGSAVLAEEGATGVAGDNNPAIAVAQKTVKSVVGVITNSSTWSRQQGDQKTMIGCGSGVVIKDGYVVTNNHVVEGGNAYEILLPSGEHADATLIGTDESTDLAVLQVNSDELVPVDIGSSSNLLVGNSVYAIGNPGGEVLANTMTSGIVSALERTKVNAGNTTRAIAYIQHDAPISSGNSGGGLFDINGDLIGINTLKYAGNAYSSASYEGLGFAIPVDTVYPIAMDLIDYGTVRRPQLGVTVLAQEGPDDARNDYPPASMFVYSVVDNGPAAKAGIQPYDFITHVDGVRVTSLPELSTELDKHQPGDTVEVTLVRYDNAASVYERFNSNMNSGNGNNYGDNYGNNYGDNYGNNYGNNYGYGYGNGGFGGFGGFFGNPFGGYYGGYDNYNGNNNNNYYSSPNQAISGTFKTITVNVTLEILENNN